MFVFWGLTHFTKHSGFQLSLFCWKFRISFFLWLSTYFEMSCLKHEGSNNYFICWFYFLWVNYGNQITGSFGRSIFKVFFFLRNLHTIFQNVCLGLYCYKSTLRYLFPIFMPAFIILWFLDDNYSNWGQVKLHCRFCLYFLNVSFPSPHFCADH